MDGKTLGAINDLTLATEFLMVALREITAGHPVDSREVQTYLGFASSKIKGLHSVPITGHKGASGEAVMAA